MRQPLVLVLVVAAVAACSSSSSSGARADAGGAGGGSSGAGSSGAGSSSGGSSGGQPMGGGTSSSSGGGTGAGSDDASAGSSSGGGSPTQSSDGSTPVVTSSGDGGLVLYGKAYTDGVYNLGPVDYSESQYHNACAPSGPPPAPVKYDPRVQAVEGVLLAGLWNGIPNTDSYCDSCIWVTTGKGKSAMLRVVTYGDTTNDSIDTSPQAYSALSDGEYPRTMTWQFAECPDTGPMMYEFQSAANADWTSLWVRNARVPLTKIEVKSVNHAQWTELTRDNGDGTATDASGFGDGTFSIRSTGMDGQQVVDTFDWPSGGIGGAFLTGKGNFQ